MDKFRTKIFYEPDTDAPITFQLFDSLKNIKNQGSLTKAQGIKILKWKSPRPLQRYQSNSDKDFQEITKLSFSTKNERVKIHILTALKGVNIPAASAILMFYDRKRYPVIDIRVWKQLFKANLVDTNPKGQGFSLDEWVNYLTIIRGIAKELKLTPRQVEKRLYDIDRREQKGNLYK